MSARIATLVLLLAALSGCGDRFYRIAVLMPGPPAQDGGQSDSKTGSQTAEHPNLSWAAETINNAGGVAGGQIALYYPDLTGASIHDVAARIAADDLFVGAIGPGSSQDVLGVADLFVAVNKPLVSFTSASAEVLRAYGGQGAVWRTRQSDIAQTELLLRWTRDQGAQRVALLTTTDTAGATFFNWFGFFAKEIGFADSAVHIGVLSEKTPCDSAVSAALKAQPQIVFLAASSGELLRCALSQLSVPGAAPPGTRFVVADTGLDPYELLGKVPPFEGFSAAGDEGYQAAFQARFPGQRLAPHGAAEYDAVLLLAYGLAASRGEGGEALLTGLRAAVDGRDGERAGWDTAGVRQALADLAAGRRPLLHGATGPLRYEPQLYVDPASSRLAHYVADGMELRFDLRLDSSDPRYLVSGGVLVAPRQDLMAMPEDQSGWTPATARTDTWALVAALSNGFSNYRHQADALQQYQLLRKAGVPDDHIVLVMADDIAAAKENALPGTVRNVPDGPNLYSGVKRDYDLSVTGDDLMNILTGQVTARTKSVLQTTAGSNLYVYLAGHGGPEGIPVGAETTEDGVNGTGALLTPKQLREALCTLRSAGRLRRGLVVIESCFAGVFGDADTSGIERGCGADGATTPLTGVVLMTAANGREVSYAGAYDRTLKSWVNDAFSNQYVTQLSSTPTPNLKALYTGLYLRVSGSHSSLFNSSAAGALGAVTIDEFFKP